GWRRTGCPLPRLRAAGSASDETSVLQDGLHPCVALTDAVVFDKLLVEVLDVKVPIPFPVQRQHLLDDLHRNPLGAGMLTAPIEKHVKPCPLEMRLPATNGPR